ncbi:MAG: Rieske 2Fe-2S domain-containing protein [Thermoproteota archaeon]
MIPTQRKVANKKDLREGGLMRVDVDGKPIVLVIVQGKVYAMDAVCSHEGGPLEEGTLQGYELKCPWHYAIFDVRNAKVSEQTVWATDLQSYPVQVDENTGDILIGLNPPPNEASIQEERAEQREPKSQRDEFILTLEGKEELRGTDIMTFRFIKEEEFPTYKAGQYAFFPLEGVANDPKGPVRHFTLASSPTEAHVIISTRIRESPYKQRLKQLQQGTKVKISEPQGEFVLQDDYSKPAVFLSGGIGVTPFRSMVKYATDNQLPLRIVMFDSNRSRENILYKKEFDQWSSKNKNLKIIYAVTDEDPAGWSDEKGRIDKAMIMRHLDNDQLENSIFYVCGPPGMLKAMQNILKNELHIPDDRIKVEEFTGY